MEDRFDAGGLTVLLVAARFNGHVVDHMVESARGCLLEHGAAEDGVPVVRVPGAWELPQAVRLAALSRRFDAVIALGCVIRGETPHFEYICAEAARGLGAAARESGVPVIFGVLTTDTEEQAVERARADGQDKGREAALAALEMVEVARRLGDPSP
ncbi:MAG TPA: 6,7-dimethyl-8-ribityllumazine synthase [Longimicrobiales bacterium]|nr:6,7-dimethyl-8-ribityllumazine synthase [Longimicrobiales bacterium]